MKRLYTLLFSLLLLNLLTAQTTEFEIAGVKVIHRMANNEVVSAQLFIKGGTNNYTKDKEGIEALSFEAATDGGTKKYPHNKFHARLEKYGSSITASSSMDYGVIELNCIRKNWDSTWNLFKDVILNPAFEPNQFQLKKQQLISAAQQRESDPDQHLQALSLANAFEGKNYAKITNGTATSLTRLTLDEARTHYEGVMAKEGIFIVIVGNVSTDEVTQKVTQLVSQLPENRKIELRDNSSKYLIDQSSIRIEERELATNYIRGMLPTPMAGSLEGTAMQIALSILSDRYFKEIRTKRSLSYAPSAGFASRLATSYGVIYVTTQYPNETIQVMLDEISTIKQNGFEPTELTNKKSTFLTHHYMGLETNASQARNLGVFEVLSSWKAADRYMDEINKLTLDDINNVVKKYLNAVSWTYLGKKADYKESIFLQEF